jgi:Protein of unknown function (DUF2934)/Carbohydrate-binding module 48 (Isoamylase N-terminal domain)
MALSRGLELIVAAMRQEPFLVLGPRVIERTLYWRAYLPTAQRAELVDRNGNRQTLWPFCDSGLFEWQGGSESMPAHPVLAWLDRDARWRLQRDAYSFASAPRLTHYPAGATGACIDGFVGTLFVSDANAAAVSVCGDFNGWDRRAHPLARGGPAHLWWLFVPGVAPRAAYRFAIERRRAFDEDQTAALHGAPDLAGIQLGCSSMATRRRRTEESAHTADEQRRARIAQAAYLRAEQRRFEPGHELDDWLAAEREVDGKPKRRTTTRRQ